MPLLLAIKALPFILQLGSLIFAHLFMAYLYHIHIHCIWITLLVLLAKHLSPVWTAEAIILATSLHPHYCLHFNPIYVLYLHGMGPFMKGLWAWDCLVNDHICQCCVETSPKEEDCSFQVPFPLCSLLQVVKGHNIGVKVISVTPKL